MSRRPPALARAAQVLALLIAALLLGVAGITACGAAPRLDERLRQLRLINYYPSAAPWTNMWNHWDRAVIDRDFGLAAGLGANAVRIIVHPDAFGFPVPDAEKTAELAQAMAMAHQHGLAVQLTLFDWWNGYRDTQGSDTWARALLAPYRDDRRLAFVELKNEIDPADPAAIAWARHELPTLRSLVGEVPVTLSVAGDDPLDRVRRLKAGLGGTQPDFYDIHYYGPPEAARAEFAAARAAVAPYPLFIGETGQPADAPGDYPMQDRYLRTVFAAARSLDLPTPAPWILRDVIPQEIPPGQDPTDTGFGLLTADGREKPAAASVRTLFTAPPAASGVRR